LVIPLAMPAIASLGIFQFLWVWNDLLVALVFLGGTTSGSHLPDQQHGHLARRGLAIADGSSVHLDAAADDRLLLLQRYFVRGMLAGAVKG
jgi:alpha-glucoside transport system permease protein